jgi:hypothetical protein
VLAKLLGSIVVALTFGLSPAIASTYAVSFATGTLSVTGTIVTDCDNCALAVSDFVSWSYILNGSISISGGDSDIIGFPSPSLEAAMGTISVIGNASFDTFFLDHFGVGALALGDGGAIGYAHGVGEFAEGPLSVGAVIGQIMAPAPGPVAGTGLSGLLVFACGGMVVWWRRRRSAVAVTA